MSVSGTSVGKIFLDLGVNPAGVKKDLTGIAGSFKSIGGIIATAFSVRAIANFSKECINLGSDLAEVQNVVDVTFGEGASTIDAWAETTKTAFGLSEMSAKQYAGTMGAMLKSTGIASDATSEMSTTLAELAGDFASFYNVDTDEAFAKIRSGISGEIEPLRVWGKNLSVANLEAYALSQGIEKSYNAMSEAEKVLLRYNYLLSVSTDQMGDYARTSGSWANQVRDLRLNIDQIKATLGQAFINVLLPCLQTVNQLIGRLQVLADKFLAFTEMFFGDAGGSSTIASTAAESIADNTAAAAGSAKEYAKALAGFDKLNILASSDSSGGSGGDSASLDMGLNTGSGSGDNGNKSKGLVQGAIDNLASVLLIGGIAALAIGALLTFTGISIPLGLALMAIGAGAIWASVKIDESSGEKSVINGLDKIAAVVSGACLAVGALLLLSGVKPILGLALMAIGAVGLAKTVQINWDGMSEKTEGILATIWTAVSVAALAVGAILCFSGANIPLGLGLMAAGAIGLATMANPNWNGMSDETRKTVTAVAGIAGAALLALGVILLFTGAGIPLGLGLILAGAGSLATAIAPNWDSIVDKIGGVCSRIKEKFTTMLQGVKDAFKVALNGIIGFANKWIDGINAILAPVRAVISGVAQAFGGSITFDDVKIPHIPALANGGYVKKNQPQLAIIGDNTRTGEIVSPENKMMEIATAANAPILAEIRALMAILASNSSGNSNQTINLNVDGKNLFELFVRYHNSIVRQTGKSPLKV